MSRARVCLSPLLLLLFAGTTWAGQPATRVLLDEKAGSPVSPLVFGAQEEIYVLPYMVPEALTSYREMGVGLLRYPCGTASDWFAWDDPEHGYWPAQWVQDRRKLYPDDYVALCRRVGFEPLITVNTSFFGPHVGEGGCQYRINPTKVESIRKGAEYAAKWVEHANIQGKACVKYWEIGNEVWIWMHPKENAAHVREYSAAMRKVDPSIKIIACGLAGGFCGEPAWLDKCFGDEPGWVKPRKTDNWAEPWTRALLEEAAGSFDYLALHIYHTGESIDPVENGRQVFAAIDENGFLTKQIAWLREHRSPARLAVTEWMVNFYWDYMFRGDKLKAGKISQEQYDRYMTISPVTSFVTTLLTADFMGQMISSGHVDIAVAHALSLGLGQYWNYEKSQPIQPPLEMPAGAAFRFWKRFAGERVVGVSVEDAPVYEFEGRKVSLLSAYATRGRDKINVILISRSPDQPLTVRVPRAFGGQAVKSVTEHAVYADGWGANVWPAVEDRSKYPIRQSTRPLPLETLDAYELRPSHLVCLELDFGGTTGSRPAPDNR